MRLEVGKVYKTRAGDKVTIVSDRMRGDDCWFGIIHYKDYDTWVGYFENGNIFKVKKDGRDIIAEWTEPKPPQYVPYTADDLPMLRGRWYINKEARSQCMVHRFTLLDGAVYINSRDAAEFMENCVWLDGTPCGKVVAE